MALWAFSVMSLEVSDERGLGHIGDAVGHHDLRQVLLLLHLAGDHRALRRGGGVGKVGVEEERWMPVFMYASLS